MHSASDSKDNGAQLIRPPRLRVGDVVAIVAPSSPLESERRHLLERSLELLKHWELRPRFAPGLWERRGYLAGDDEHRASQIIWALKDPSVRAVFPIRGGYGSTRLLERLPFHLLKEDPKIVIGCSDVTALLLAFCSQSGVVTFHGPNLSDPGLAMGPHSPTAESLHRALFDVMPPEPIHLKPVHDGIAHGPILGGCLSIVASLIGTRFLPSFSGAVLFLEDTNEPLYRIDRMLWQLHLSGLFGETGGLAMGRFGPLHGCPASKRMGSLMEEVPSFAGLPLAIGLSSGHSRPNLTIPLGVETVLDAREGVLSFTQAGVI